MMLRSRNKNGYLRKKMSRQSGFSLLELIIAIIILGIVAVGSLHYHFYAAQQIRTTKAEQTAMRTAQLLLEDWKSNGGDSNYNPQELEMGFTSFDTDAYMVTIDDLPMTVKLFCSDVDTDTVSSVTLRKIQALVRWRSDYGMGTVTLDDPMYVMTTYVRLDQAGG